MGEIQFARSLIANHRCAAHLMFIKLIVLTVEKLQTIACVSAYNAVTNKLVNKEK